MSTCRCNLNKILNNILICSTCSMNHRMNPLNLLVILLLVTLTMGKKIKRRQNKSNTLVVDSGSSQCVCGNRFVAEKLCGKITKARMERKGLRQLNQKSSMSALNHALKKIPACYQFRMVQMLLQMKIKMNPCYTGSIAEDA